MGKGKDVFDILLKNRRIVTKKDREDFFNPKDPVKISLKEFGISEAEVKKSIKRIKEAIRKKEKIIVSENDHKTVIIPPGVWHGYTALKPSIMAFYLSHKYDPKDEFRKKIDPSEWKVPNLCKKK